EDYRGRRKAVAGGNPEAYRRRNQENGRDEQSEGEGSAGAEIGRWSLVVGQEQNRRVGWASFTGCLLFLRQEMHTSDRPYNRRAMKKVIHAACPHDCPDACGVLITVQDGRATKIQGDPTHPVTRGFLCAKVAKYLDRVYSPDRVLYPMRRGGPKGLPR